MTNTMIASKLILLADTNEPVRLRVLKSREVNMFSGVYLIESKRESSKSRLFSVFQCAPISQ